MSVEDPNTIGGIGIEGGTKIVMLISDHLTWNDPSHIPQLKSKIQAYANASLSNQTAKMIPDAVGNSHLIRLVHQNLPTDDAIQWLANVRQQLERIDIEFEHTLLPHDY